MTVSRSFLLVLAALACAILALVVALGAGLGDSTFEEWIAGAFVAYFGSLLP